MNIGGSMSTTTIIEHLDAELLLLQQVKALLADDGVRRGPGRPKTSEVVSIPVAPKLTKRVMSSEGKKKIAFAQKDRWARIRSAAKKATNTQKIAETTIKDGKVAKSAKATATGKAIKKAPAPAAKAQP
jgi:hypothetical protein